MAKLLARIERRIVGGFMRLVAVIAERRVKRSLDDKSGPHGRAHLHVDLEDKFR